MKLFPILLACVAQAQGNLVATFLHSKLQLLKF